MSMRACAAAAPAAGLCYGPACAYILPIRRESSAARRCALAPGSVLALAARRAPTRSSGATSRAASSTATTPRTPRALRESAAAVDRRRRVPRTGCTATTRRCSPGAWRSSPRRHPRPGPSRRRARRSAACTRLDGCWRRRLTLPKASRCVRRAWPRRWRGGGLHVPFAGSRAPRKDIERALALAPKNPRVLLVDALGDYQLAPRWAATRSGRCRSCGARSRPSRPSARDRARCRAGARRRRTVYLGRDLLDHGDPVGARDALEHALLLAPEYAQARRLMAKITCG